MAIQTYHASPSSVGRELLGSASPDLLQGGDGADTIDGREGADTMIGGADRDIYYVDNAGE